MQELRDDRRDRGECVEGCGEDLNSRKEQGLLATDRTRCDDCAGFKNDRTNDSRGVLREELRQKTNAETAEAVENATWALWAIAHSRTHLLWIEKLYERRARLLLTSGISLPPKPAPPGTLREPPSRGSFHPPSVRDRVAYDPEYWDVYGWLEKVTPALSKKGPRKRDLKDLVWDLFDDYPLLREYSLAVNHMWRRVPIMAERSHESKWQEDWLPFISELSQWLVQHADELSNYVWRMKEAVRAQYYLLKWNRPELAKCCHSEPLRVDKSDLDFNVKVQEKVQWPA